VIDSAGRSVPLVVNCAVNAPCVPSPERSCRSSCFSGTERPRRATTAVSNALIALRRVFVNVRESLYPRAKELGIKRLTVDRAASLPRQGAPECPLCRIWEPSAERFVSLATHPPKLKESAPGPRCCDVGFGTGSYGR